MTRPEVRVEPLLTPAEAARLFGVHARTLKRWCDAGRLVTRRTVGGHRRVTVDSVRAALLEGGATDADVDALLAGVGQ